MQFYQILSIIQRAGTIAENDTYDSLMNDAIRVVLSAGQASTGLIQKELKIVKCSSNVQVKFRNFAA